jgi:hypothetical protein
MAARYAGDIFYRSQMGDASRDYAKESDLKRRFKDLRTLYTPKQKEFQQNYVDTLKALSELKATKELNLF